MERTYLIVVFVLLMSDSSTILVSEGRNLRLRNDSSEVQTSNNHKLTGKSTYTTANGDQLAPEVPTQIVKAAQPPPPQAGHLDSFRPTTPGHSPGAGHSLQLQVSSEHMVKDASNTSDEKNTHAHAGNTFKTANSNEVVPEAQKPTTRGHSPGAGHSIQN